MTGKAALKGSFARYQSHKPVVFCKSDCWWARVVVLLLGLTGCAAAQTFTLLHSFAGAATGDGSLPGYGPLVQAFDGNLYGTTIQGGTTCSFEGAVGCGQLFKITTAGAISAVYNFCATGSCPDGNFPEGGVALRENGTLYGMTALGGTSGIGSVYRLPPAGALDSFFSFDGTIGAEPISTLMRASNGNLYGITQAAGPTGSGTIIEINATDLVTLLQSLNTATTGGAQSDPAELVQGSDGNFYGVATSGGGTGKVGTVFKITPNGVITVLHAFTGSPDGREPTGTLVEGPDGNFYGTTNAGGATDHGTLFRITPTGVVKILHSFCKVNGCPDGFDPVGGPILGTDGKLYGTTQGGGTGGHPGTVFQSTLGGTLATLHNFAGLDGAKPLAGLVQHTDGDFYGTTTNGGANDMGTVFSISMHLKPFVQLFETTGPVGTPVTILGTGLSSATKVSFGGTAAVFHIASDGEITTTVPPGGKTGFVTVKTPTVSFNSSKKFLVTPQLTGFSPASGPVGTSVTITGESFSQTKKVTFNGTAATPVTINSDKQITVAVPAGATTGVITITTLGGSVSSPTSFTVTP